MNPEAALALVVACIAILSAVIGFLRSLKMEVKQERDKERLYEHVEKKTNGQWHQAEMDLMKRFTDLERRLQREMHERIGRELDEIRKARKQTGE